MNKLENRIVLKRNLKESNKENIRKSIKEDVFDRNKFLINFINILVSINGAFTLSLDAKWGMGKTFFVKQAIEMIKELQNKLVNNDIYDKNSENELLGSFNALRIKEIKENMGNKNIECIYYDAWRNDNVTDPTVSIFLEILELTDAMGDIDKEIIKWVKTSIGIGISFLKGVTGIDLEIKDDVEENKNDLYKIIKAAKANKQDNALINSFINEYCERKNKKIIIFIDELDRCKPTYAVKVLEMIKHYFDNDNIVFVFSTNIAELSCTIKKVYGYEFDAYRYLDRFFDMNIILPDISNQYLEKYIEQLWGEESWIWIAKIIIKKFDLTVRECERCIRYMEVMLKISSQLDFANKETKFIYYLMIPTLIGLKFKDGEMYDDIISGKGEDEFIEVMEMINKLIGEEMIKACYTEEKDVENELSNRYNSLFNDGNGNIKEKMTMLRIKDFTKVK